MIVEGEWWERLRDVPGIVPGMPAGTVRAWASSGRIRKVRVGRESWVCMTDVFDADAESNRRRRARSEKDS